MADEEKELIYQHMEAILVRLGQADMNCERLRHAAMEETDPVQKAGKEQMAELAMNRLSMIATEAIELGRALAVRQQKKTPTVPSQIPEAIKVEESTYKGSEGIPKDSELAYIVPVTTSKEKPN